MRSSRFYDGAWIKMTWITRTRSWIDELKHFHGDSVAFFVFIVSGLHAGSPAGCAESWR